MGNDSPTASDEPFELLELLGSGGFAHTYRAKVLDRDLVQDFGAEIVALKIPLNKKKGLVLKRELVINATLHLHLKNLQSINLVRYLGFTVFQNQIVMAMEYVKNGSLRNRLGDIGRQKRLPVDEAVRIAQEVLKGLMVIHQEHVFHRDIKPENILMDGNTAKIADLGIARMLESNELASTTTGTIYYMSPELLSEQGAAFTSDIWSLAITLYEMVTGRLPFGEPDTPIGKMVDLIRCAKPVPAGEVCPEVPVSLSNIIDRGLSKNPADRYASAEEMYEALKHYKQEPDGEIEKELAPIRELMSGTGEMGVIEERLQAIVRKFPRNAKAYQYLGELYNRCQRYAEAIAAFKKGLEFDANNALLYWDLALASQGTGQLAEAARNLKKAESLNLDASLRRILPTLLKALHKGGEDDRL